MDFTRFEPSKTLRSLRSEVDNLFDRFVERPLNAITGQAVPPLDVCESDTDILVKMELPGVDEKDIDVSIQNEALTIRGQKKEDREEAGRIYHVVERMTGHFSRTIQIPVPVRVDMIHAMFKNGILEVRLPKKELSQAKKIEIKTECT